MFSGEYLEAQHAVCERFGVPHFPTRLDLKVGINLKGDAYPMNGYRERWDPAYDTLTGWWIWNGERDISRREPDFFDGLHASHLPERCPDIVPYLGLPPG